MCGRIGLVAVFMTLASVLAEDHVEGHEVHVFAHVHGTEIHGEVIAGGDVPMAGAAVTAYGPGGEKLGETASDAEGQFRLTATQRCDWKIVAEGDGHRATYTVLAAELPASLPEAGSEDKAPSPDAQKQDASADDEAEKTHEHPHEHAHSHDPGAGVAAKEGDSELSRQIVALRKDIEQLRRTRQWQDIVGGVGYILGLMGIAAYFLGGRRRERDS